MRRLMWSDFVALVWVGVVAAITVGPALADDLSDYFDEEYFDTQFYYDHRIRFRSPRDLCLHRKGDAVKAQNCVRSRDQVWTLTLRGELRNTKARNKCLTASSLNQPVTLTNCSISNGRRNSVSANQVWRISGKHLKNGSNCLAIDSRKEGYPLKLKSCDTTRSKRRFWFGDEVRKPTAHGFANMGFTQFRRCLVVELDNDANCRLRASQAGITWGFRYWTTQEPAHEDRSRTLDLGERYSVDRCALAHDEHWVDQGLDGLGQVAGIDAIANKNSITNYATQMNLIHFINCLKRVEPSNRDEDHALNVGVNSFHVPLRCGYHKYARTHGKARDGWGLLTSRSNSALTVPLPGDYPSYAERKCVFQ